VLDFKYVPYSKPSADFLWTFYFYRGFFNYRCALQGDFSFWTENIDHGETPGPKLLGKRFFLYGEPQFWYRIKGSFSAGTKINVYYHIYTSANSWQVYPALAVRWKL
jgi:hypothetical protein